MLVLLIVSILLWLYLFPILRRKWVLRSVPGLEGNWLLGHAKYFINAQPPEILKTIQRGYRECGKVWKIFLLHETLVMVSDPKILEVILSSPKYITKSGEYDMISDWLGDGLILSGGKKWAERRKAITPAFHFKILEQFVEVFDRNSSILVEKMGKFKPMETVDVHPLVNLAALDIICETSMGASVNAQVNSDSEYVKAAKTMVHILHLRIFDVWLRNNFTFSFSEWSKKEKAAIKVLHDFTDSVIEARRKELMDEEHPQNIVADETDLGIKKKKVLLDILLQSEINGKRLTNSDIREEVDNFMFAGHDTTTSGIAFALFCLAKHPKVQAKVIAEIHEVIGKDKKAPLTMRMLNELHYMDLVIKEVLRLYATVPMVARAVEEDMEFEGIKIPKGCTLMIGIFYMHRDPKFFPNPEEFMPERHSVQRTADEINPFTYIPFSAGPRNCIGQKFAVLEMKSMISKILRHFELFVDPSFKGPELLAESVLKSQNGIQLNLKPRN